MLELYFASRGSKVKPFEIHHNTIDKNLVLHTDRVYKIGYVFRNETISAWHNPKLARIYMM